MHIEPFYVKRKSVLTVISLRKKKEIKAKKEDISKENLEFQFPGDFLENVEDIIKLCSQYLQ